MAMCRFLNLCQRNKNFRGFLISSCHPQSTLLEALSGQVCHQSNHAPVVSFISTTSRKQCSTFVNTVRLVHTSRCLAAGHSKWHNIKHIKAANDRERGAKSSLLARRIQVTLDKNPETDPKLNTDLANLIKWARTNNIPNDTIEKTLDRQVKLRDPKCITAFDGRGPSNTGIIIECFALKPQHTKSLLQGIVKKFGFNLHSPAEDLFDHKGMVEVELPEEEVSAAQSGPGDFSLDKYIDMAIEAGAEDVMLETDDEKPYLKFVCGPFDVSKISKSLSDCGLTVVSGERTYIPKVVVPVSAEFLDNLSKLSDKLDLHSDVIKYHFNVEPES